MDKTGKVKQMGVGLPELLRAQLERAAKDAGHSIAAEIRSRLERTFKEDADDQATRALAVAVVNFAALVRLQTGHAWHSHPAASRVMRQAIISRLARLKGGWEEEAAFAPGELPTARIFAPGSDDPREMGLALEAAEFYSPPDNDPRVRKLREDFERNVREKHAQWLASKNKEEGTS